MKNYLLIILVSGIYTSNAQVGIGTDNPRATLDVNGNLKVRGITEVPAITSSHSIVLRDTSVSGDNEFVEISSDNFFASGSSAYSAQKEGNWSLLDLGISGTNWNKINITGTDTKIGDPGLFTDGVFTAPQSGIYMVNYEFQMQAGVNIELLGNKKLGLIKNGNTVWDEKLFDAVRVSLLGITVAAIPVTSSSMSTLVQLNAGETLTFAVETGGIDLGLLTDNKVSLYIYKISN